MVGTVGSRARLDRIVCAAEFLIENRSSVVPYLSEQLRKLRGQVLEWIRFRGPGSLACAGCRYTDSSVCMMRRGSPPVSRSSRSIEPYDSNRPAAHPADQLG